MDPLAPGPPENKTSRTGGDDATPAAPVFEVQSREEQRLHSDEVGENIIY